MTAENDNNIPSEALAYFENANKAAEAGNFDEAIEMYIEALRIAPEAVNDGHIKLREVAGRRRSQGGPKPSSDEVKERLRGADALERMLNAEYLLAKDPGYMPYGEAMLKGAVEGGYHKAAKWIADLMFVANKRAKKPSLQLYGLLIDSYARIEEYDRALSACESGLRIKPEDEGLKRQREELLEKVSAGKGGESEFLEESFAEQQEPEELEQGISGGERTPGPVAEEGFGAADAKAASFFIKARQAAERKDYDYAIQMYIEGLRFSPDALQDGHLKLCHLALERKKRGGKKPSMMEKVKHIRSKGPLEQMLNAEYLFAKDPSNLSHAGSVLKAAVAGGYNKTANWIANYLFQENNNLDKPSFQTYVLLKDSYRQLGQYDKAVAACQRALQIKPNDQVLNEDLKSLTAELTVSRGKYDQEGDFRKSTKDFERQEQLLAEEGRVKTKDYRLTALEQARKALADEPDLPKNIYNLAKALVTMGDEQSENEAIGLLEKAYKDKNDFSYKQQAGQIRITQIKRKIRAKHELLEDNPEDGDAKQVLEELVRQLAKVEKEHYRLCVKNYPTDLQAKYEYGLRLLADENYDEAIPLFQEAKKDPRHRVSATGKIGLCFFNKGWYTDSIDIFTEAIDKHDSKDDNVAKELRYNLGKAYEKEGQKDKALEIYRKIAQLDFGYKDVRQRVDKLRSSNNRQGTN